MARNLSLETYLTKSRIDWDYQPDFALNQINVKRSLDNQARLGTPLEETLVERYALALVEGAEMPAVVGFWDRGEVTLVDGNHRLAAMQRVAISKSDFYQIKSDDGAIRDWLTRTLNLREGKTLSHDEALRQARYWVKHHKATVKEASARFGLSVSALKDFITADRVRERLPKLGIKPNGLTNTTLRNLAVLDNDHVLAKAAEIAIGAQLTADETSELTRVIRAERTEAGQLQAIEAFASRPEIRGRMSRVPRIKHMAARTRFLMSIRIARRLLAEAGSLAGLAITADSEVATVTADLDALVDLVTQ